MAPRSWDVYKSDPALTGARVEVGGVEHWPRGAVRAFQDSRPGGFRDTGRPAPAHR
ncbi:hypothetical protein ACJBCE_00145 [Streptomyces sp. NBUL23]|uniref:hypothetical protein n=1 Tax=Streptomyces sp. NBUL23 TaxID=3381354 RepID=UPI003871BF46